MSDLETAMQLLDGSAENAINEGMAGVMVVTTDGNRMITSPKYANDVDKRVASLIMLGSHIDHMVETVDRAGGDATADDIVRDAINYLEEFKHDGGERVGL